MKYNITPVDTIHGSVVCPPDKSISHRALLFNALAGGKSQIHNLLQSADVLSTAQCLRQLGVKITASSTGIWNIDSTQGFTPSALPLNCGNSGTTMRILCGILSTFPFESILIGDESLSNRPMSRLIKPLSEMGVHISGRQNKFAPITIRGHQSLPFFEYHLPIASAQVKTALMLVGLRCNGAFVSGGGRSRDHTERILTSMGAQLETQDGDVRIFPGKLINSDITIPGDFSSAAFLLTAATLASPQGVTVRNVNLNPTRTGFLQVLKEMGANIQINTTNQVCGEPVGDISVFQSHLHGVDVPPELVPTMIDEVPLIAVLGAVASGKTRVRGAEELRVKESDRISAILHNISLLGICFDEYSDGFAIHGSQSIGGSRKLSSFGDHRIAMATSIAASFGSSPSTIDNTTCIDVSFPGFHQKVSNLGLKLQQVT